MCSLAALTCDMSVPLQKVFASEVTSGGRRLVDSRRASRDEKVLMTTSSHAAPGNVSP